MVLKSKTTRSRERYEAQHSLNLRQGQIRRHQPTAVAIARPFPISNQQIDFWLLALCSCVLTLLCHAMTTVPQTSSAGGTAIATQSTTSTQSHSTFTFKLLTLTTPKPELEDDEE